MFLRSFVIVLYCPLGLNRSLCQFRAVLLPFSATRAASLQFVVDSRSMYVHGFRYLIHLYATFAHSFNSLPVLKTQPCVFTCHRFRPPFLSLNKKIKRDRVFTPYRALHFSYSW